MNIIIRKCIPVIVFGLAIPFVLHAQQKNTPPQKTASNANLKAASPANNPAASKSTVINVYNEEVDIADVGKAVNEVVSKLKKEKESDPVPVTLLMCYENKFIDFTKFSRIETDTRISIVWFKNVSESLDKLANIKRNIKTATFNKDGKQLEELNKIYKEFVAKTIYLLEHPQKISERK